MLETPLIHSRTPLHIFHENDTANLRDSATAPRVWNFGDNIARRRCDEASGVTRLTINPEYHRLNSQF
jgi:hypothetical protein